MIKATGYLAALLRRAADRIDPDGAPRFMSYSFTFEDREGIRFRDDGKGCPMLYLGRADYERAHAEADTPGARVDWATGRVLRMPD